MLGLLDFHHGNEPPREKPPQRLLAVGLELQARVRGQLRACVEKRKRNSGSVLGEKSTAKQNLQAFLPTTTGAHPQRLLVQQLWNPVAQPAANDQVTCRVIQEVEKDARERVRLFARKVQLVAVQEGTRREIQSSAAP